jgi:aldose 1-epimerase
MTLEKTPLDNLLGHNTWLHTITNDWMEVTISTFGCTITSIMIPGKNGVKRNIVLAYDDIARYIDDPFYIGCIVGRYAGRISGASFTIDGKLFSLPPNDGHSGNHLHGGYSGFNKKNFQLLKSTHDDESASLVFHYRSPHLEEGYPGNLDVWITFALTNDNKIIIGYRAITDHATYINLTNHTYFNFTGNRESATGHELVIHADAYVQTGEDYIPDGVLRNVNGMGHDFRVKRKIEAVYNECFVLNKSDEINAVLSEESSGIHMAVSTSLPGLLLYTGDFLANNFTKNQGVCLETQYFPDSPHQPKFPSTLLIPGDEYVENTVWQFYVE